MKTTTAILVVGVAIALTGCSSLGSPSVPSQSAGGVAQAQTNHEYATPAPHQTAADAAAGPIEAIRSFARAYINWNAQTVAGDMRALATRSVGQARSALQLAAAQTANDYELRRGGIANSGSVQAVAPLDGSRDRYVVVTRETTTATATDAYQGLRPAWHLTIATVTRVPGGRWALSGWQPQS